MGNAIPQLLGVFWQCERRMLIAAKLVMSKTVVWEHVPVKIVSFHKIRHFRLI